MERSRDEQYTWLEERRDQNSGLERIMCLDDNGEQKANMLH